MNGLMSFPETSLHKLKGLIMHNHNSECNYHLHFVNLYVKQKKEDFKNGRIKVKINVIVYISILAISVISYKVLSHQFLSFK